MSIYINNSKNLIQFPYYRKSPYSVNGITYTVQEDSGIKVLGQTTTKGATYQLTDRRTLPLGTYTISGGRDNVYLDVIKNEQWLCRSTNGKPATFTVDNETDIFYLYLYVAANSIIDTIIYPMFNEGAEAYPHEPYNKLTKVKAYINNSKNLIPFPYRQSSYTSNGVTFTVNDTDGSILVNGQNNNVNNSAGHLLKPGVPFIMKANVPYTFSIKANTNAINLTVQLPGPKWYSAVKDKSVTLILPEDTTVSSIYIQVNKGNTSNFVNEFVQLMVNEGETALPYEPYNKLTKVKFIKPTIPKEYQRVEYIESTGTQYIDTGYKLSNNSDVELIISDLCINNLRGGGRFFGAWTTTTSNRYAFNIYSGSSLAMSYGNTTSGSKYQFSAKKIKIAGIEDKFYVDDVLIHEFDNSPFNTEYSAYIFATHVPSANDMINPDRLKIYSCKIWNNKILIRNFIPCYRKVDGEVGLYDTINNKFYINNGTGTFLKGADIL